MAWQANGMRLFGAMLLALAVLALGGLGDGWHGGAAVAQDAGNVPGGALGNRSDTELWRQLRLGNPGSATLPNPQAAVAIQSDGEAWRSVRNGPLSTVGVWVLLGTIALLALFFLLRGRIRIEHGRSGRTVVRFGGVERFAHWITAISFIVLGLTGLNILYGRYLLLPLIGPEAFAAITLAGKYLHNYLAFAFMLGIVMMLVLWVAENMPSRHDLTWFAKGGGLLRKGVHPPATKFNAGQKIVFWLVVLSGISLSLSGVALLFPFEFSFFSETFRFLNLFGFSLPTDLTLMQEMQLAQLWHAVLAVVMVAIILAHIYIGTIGMEGAFDAMASGQVDANWAREHHSLWVDESDGRHGGPAPQAATGDD